jgi:hypothetical protein
MEYPCSTIVADPVDGPIVFEEVSPPRVNRFRISQCHPHQPGQSISSLCSILSVGILGPINYATKLNEICFCDPVALTDIYLLS